MKKISFHHFLIHTQSTSIALLDIIFLSGEFEWRVIVKRENEVWLLSDHIYDEKKKNKNSRIIIKK